MPTYEINPKLPVRATGARRKTFRTAKEFREWIGEGRYVVVATYADKLGTEVFLHPAEKAKK